MSIKSVIARLAAFAVIVFTFSHVTDLAAAEQAWTLQETSGQVRLVKPGLSPIALTTGDTFSGGDWIETGPDGRAIVIRGEESIVLAPNSRIGLPKNNTESFATRILQTLGTILLTVEKKANQHFVVETPYLAAVVKGTTFTVGIRGQRTVVHVITGLVEVLDLASGQRGMVRPGQTGVVLSNSGSGVSIDGAPAGAASGQNSAAASSQGSSKRAENANDSGAQSREIAASRVAIRDALGPNKIDLNKTTGGLMRESNVDNGVGNSGNSSFSEANSSTTGALNADGTGNTRSGDSGSSSSLATNAGRRSSPRRRQS